MHFGSKRSQEVILGVKTTLNEVIKTCTFAPGTSSRRKNEVNRARAAKNGRSGLRRGGFLIHLFINRESFGQLVYTENGRSNQSQAQNFQNNGKTNQFRGHRPILFRSTEC